MGLSGGESWKGRGCQSSRPPLEHVVGPTRGSATGPEPDWWRWPAITVVVALWSFHQCPWQDDARKLAHANSPPEAEEVCAEAWFQSAGRSWGPVGSGYTGHFEVRVLDTCSQGKGHMESEAGSEAGRAIQASWNAVDLGGGLQEAGTPGPPGTAGPLGPRQAAACGRASEASVFWVEAMQEGESLGAEQEEIRLGEDIVETVQVLTGAVVAEDAELQEKKAVSDMDRREEPVQPAVWEEQGQASAKEEKLAEPEQALAGRNRSWGRSPLEALEALQLEMEPMNKQARRAQCRLQLRISKRWKPYLELRGNIIQDIHGFWATVVSLML